jgi:hypothetical protein
MDKVLSGEIVNYEDKIPYKHRNRFIEVNYTPDMDKEGNVKGSVFTFALPVAH